MPAPAHGRFYLLLSLLLCAGISRRAPGDNPPFAYRTSSNEVRFSFSAVDRYGQGMTALQAKDVAVVDNETVVREFRSFSRSEVKNVEIAILLDNSASVARYSQEQIDRALESLFPTAPDANISVFTFERAQPVLVCTGNCRPTGPIEGRIVSQAGGLTPLFDAVVLASRFLSQHSDGDSARVLIAFSDGKDTASRNSLADAIAAAQDADVQIFSIDLADAPSSSSGAPVLNHLTQSTGGKYFSGPDAGTFALHAVLECLRATYTVSYRVPSLVPGFHPVRILPTHNRNLEFLSRGGYFYPNRIP